MHSAKTAEVLVVRMRRQNDAVKSGRVSAEAVAATARIPSQCSEESP